MLSERLVFVKALAPAADRFNTNPTSDVINAGYGKKVGFLVYHQGGTTGVGKIQIEACSNNAGDNNEAVAFRYRKGTTGDSNAMGAVTEATSADGVSTVAAEDAIIEVSVNADELPAGKPFVRLKITETTNDPVNAAVIGYVEDVRFAGETLPNVLS